MLRYHRLRISQLQDWMGFQYWQVSCSCWYLASSLSYKPVVAKARRHLWLRRGEIMGRRPA